MLLAPFYRKRHSSGKMGLGRVIGITEPIANMGIATQSPRGGNVRNLAILVLKLLVTGACFWYVSRQIDAGKFVRAVSSLNPAWAALSALVILAELPLVALRWQKILQALQPMDRWPLRDIVAITAIGTFFGQVLPYLAADTMRVWLLMNFGKGWRDGLVSVPLDRGVAVIALVALSCLVLLFPSALADQAGYRNFALLGFGAILLICLIGMAAARPISAVLRQWRFTRWLGQFGLLAHDVLLRSRSSPAIFALAITVHACTVLSIYWLGWALGLALSLLDSAVLFTVMISVALFPISIGGWGVRELAVTSVLQNQGLPVEQALLFSVCFGLIVIIASSPGAVVWAFYSPGHSRARLPMRE